MSERVSEQASERVIIVIVIFIALYSPKGGIGLFTIKV